MHVITVTFDVKPDHVNAFREAMLEQARASLDRETDCHQFDVAFDPDEPTVCFLYELYSNRAAFEAHLRTPHFKKFDEKVSTWLTGKSVRAFERAWPKI